jgi:hypothetical protein
MLSATSAVSQRSITWSPTRYGTMDVCMRFDWDCDIVVSHTPPIRARAYPTGAEKQSFRLCVISRQTSRFGCDFEFFGGNIVFSIVSNFVFKELYLTFIIGFGWLCVLAAVLRCGCEQSKPTDCVGQHRIRAFFILLKMNCIEMSTKYVHLIYIIAWSQQYLCIFSDC